MKTTILLIIICLVWAGNLCSQEFNERRFRNAVWDLEAPSAAERARAVITIANMPDDQEVDRQLRLNYKGAEPNLKAGLLSAAKIRGTDGLLLKAIEDIKDQDERVSSAVEDYILSLSDDQLDIQTDDAGFKALRIEVVRRRIMIPLIRATRQQSSRIYFDNIKPWYAISERLMEVANFEDCVHASLVHSVEQLNQSTDFDDEFAEDWLHRLHMMVEVFSKDTKVKIWYSACQKVMDLQLAAIRALRELPDAKNQLDKIRSLILLKATKPQITNGWDRSYILSKIAAYLVPFGERKYFDAIIEQEDACLEKMRSDTVNRAVIVMYKGEERHNLKVAQMYMDAELYEDAEDLYDELIKSTTPKPNERMTANEEQILRASYYNRACAKSCRMQTKEALVDLKKAVELGYKDWDWISKDSDFEFLRRTEEFQEWFKKYAPPHLQPKE